jgi:hypothetical protein
VLIDSHAHVDGPEFDGDRDEVLARARAAGVERIVVIGAVGDPSSAERSVALAETDDRVWATVATHPHDVEKMTADWWAVHERLAPGRHWRDRARLLLRSLAPAGAAGGVRAVHRPRPPRGEARRLPYPRRARGCPGDPRRAPRGRARRRHSLLHGHARRCGRLRRGRLIRLVLLHRRVQDRPAAPRQRPPGPTRPPPDRDGLPLPGSDPETRQAERTRLPDPHRRGRGRRSWHEFRGVSRADDRQHGPDFSAAAGPFAGLTARSVAGIHAALL